MRFRLFVEEQDTFNRVIQDYEKQASITGLPKGWETWTPMQKYMHVFWIYNKSKATPRQYQTNTKPYTPSNVKDPQPQQQQQNNPNSLWTRFKKLWSN